MDLSNYATKTNLKGARGVDISNLATKVDSTSLKAQIDKIDIEKLKTVLVDLCKLKNVVDNDFAKTTVYHKLVIKTNTILKYQVLVD